MKTLTASTKSPRLIITGIFATLALSCGVVSMASDVDDVPQAVVKFGDLNLASPQGAARLYRRIVAAAHEVCKSFDIDIHNLVFSAQQIACVHRAVRNGVAKVNQPALSAIYNARNLDPLPITVAAVENR